MRFQIDKAAGAGENGARTYDIKIDKGRAGDGGTINNLELMFEELARTMKQDFGHNGQIIIIYNPSDSSRNSFRLQAAPLNNIPQDWPLRYAR